MASAKGLVAGTSGKGPAARVSGASDPATDHGSNTASTASTADSSIGTLIRRATDISTPSTLPPRLKERMIAAPPGPGLGHPAHRVAEVVISTTAHGEAEPLQDPEVLLGRQAREAGALVGRPRGRVAGVAAGVDDRQRPPGAPDLLHGVLGEGHADPRAVARRVHG